MAGNNSTWSRQSKDYSSGEIVCRDCNQVKPLSEYYSRKSFDRITYLNHCKPCAITRSKMAYEKFKLNHDGKSPNVVRYVPRFDYPVRQCKFCREDFKAKQPSQIFCKPRCKIDNRIANMTTEEQYKILSGNLEKYMVTLLGRKPRKEDGLTKEVLLDLYAAQKGKCALSGVDMTFKREKGVRCPTNISVDRIEAGGKYSPDNVQLVCSALNKFRIDTPLNEYIDWCKKVAEFHAER